MRDPKGAIGYISAQKRLHPPGAEVREAASARRGNVLRPCVFAFFSGGHQLWCPCFMNRDVIVALACP